MSFSLRDAIPESINVVLQRQISEISVGLTNIRGITMVNPGQYLHKMSIAYHYLISVLSLTNGYSHEIYPGRQVPDIYLLID